MALRSRNPWPAVLLLALLATGAEATLVKETMTMQVRGLPADLQSGVSQEMTLVFKAFDLASLEDVRLEGSGWTVAPLDEARARVMNKGDTVELRYEVTPVVAGRPLTVSWTLDGEEKQTVLESEHMFPRPGTSIRTGPAEVRASSADRTDRAQPWPPTPPLAEQDPAFSEIDIDKTAEKATYRVTGRVAFSRQRVSPGSEADRVILGADAVTVRVFDWNRSIDLELGSTTTDEYGFFDLTVTWFPIPVLGEFDPDLYVRYESRNSRTSVGRSNWLYPYYWDSEIYHDFNGTHLNVGTLRPGSNEAALQILMSVTRGWRWINANSGTSLNFVGVHWPDNDHPTGAYTYPSEVIHIPDTRTWNEALHIHEFGHHFEYNVIGISNHDYCNGICDNNGCGHCFWCEEDIYNAWSEGFANWCGDAATRDWSTVPDYERGPLMFYPSESVQECWIDGAFGDAYITEGFVGALLNDIDDAAADDDSVSLGFVDKLSLGAAAVFDVNTSRNWWEIQSIEHFIGFLMEDYPNLRQEIWETARNNGYTGLDTTPPTTATPSSSHGGVPSIDATITMSWSGATDDLSGVAGYSYAMSTTQLTPPTLAGPMVDASVFTYTTNPLAPGSYYFTIRTFDKAGNANPSYAMMGPLVIRAADPADLLPFAGSGWDFPVVPRNDPDVAGLSGVPAETGVLDQSCYWNMNTINTGDYQIPSGTHYALVVDGIPRVTRSAPTFYPLGHEDAVTNWGPITIRGGRHTYEGRADYYEIASEADENNNDWGKQWIWNPTVFVSVTNMTRSAPPPRTGGWASVSGGQWYNCDGLRFISGPGTNIFAGVMILPSDPLRDYDARLHDLATGSTSGFSTNLGYSGRPARCVDAVLVNTANRPRAGYDVGVLNPSSATTGDYYAEVLYATGLTLNTPVGEVLSLGKSMKLFKFNITAASQGQQSIQFAADAFWTQNPVYVAWYDETFATGDLLDYTAVAVTGDDGYVQLDINAMPGQHGIAIWRDIKDGSLSNRSYTIEVGEPPADLATRVPPGWAAPLVPRPVADATTSYAPEPTNLPGDLASTYFNYAFENSSTGDAGSFYVETYVDGIQIMSHYNSPLAGGNRRYFTSPVATTVRGGRHTVNLRIDRVDAVPELVENNNTFGTQYVWTPAPVSLDTPVWRPEPGPRTAYWDHVTTGEDLWYNCDGVRTPSFQPVGDNGYWGAVAVMPDLDSDVDLQIHPASLGPRDGFSVPLADSRWPRNQVDFVLMNFNHESLRTFDAGILQTPESKNSDYMLVATESRYAGSNPIGPYGPFTFAAEKLVDLHEFQFSGSGSYRFTLDIATPAAVLGMSLYGPDQPTYGKSDVFDDGVVGPAIAIDEPLEFEILTTGYYCLAVWRVDNTSSKAPVDYGIDVYLEGVSAVGDDPAVPRVTRIAEAYPNPFNPRTTIAFDLAEPAAVQMNVYDLRGHLVRNLVREAFPAGRHEKIWDGTDNRGGRAGSGSYIVRMTAGTDVSSARITLVK